jgi:hypothetical protein
MATETTTFPFQDLAAAHDGPDIDRARRRLAGRGTSGLGSITLRVGGEAVTIRPGDEVTILHGDVDDAQLVVEFTSPEAFSAFRHELLTVPGLQVTGGVRYVAGGYAEFDAWEPALRALYQGRPIFDPADIDLADASRSFDWDADDVELADFLDRYGWAHVRGVLSTAEIAQLDAEVRRIEEASRPDIPGSWWTHDGEGNELACQLHYLGLASSIIGALDDDPRILRLVALAGGDLVSHPDRALGTFAVLKRGGASEGLTNLPWHIDCGLGGHPLTCPGLHIGVQLSASNPELGAFSILPGSHRSSVRRDGIHAGSWPVVTADTKPGDVTLHVPHALHAAPAPRDSRVGRRTLYLGFGPQSLFDAVGPGQAFDDLITQTSADGHVRFNADAPTAD